MAVTYTQLQTHMEGILKVQRVVRLPLKHNGEIFKNK